MGKHRAVPRHGTPQPRIYEAKRELDGGVRRIREITLTEAVSLRRRGTDVVVCGGTVGENRRLAAWIEQQANVAGRCIVRMLRLVAMPFPTCNRK